MTTDPYYNRLHLDISIDMSTYNTNARVDIKNNAEEELDTYESVNLTVPYEHSPELAKDGADVEVIPASLSGVKFAYIRVLVEKLVDAPVQGTFKAKVTSAGGGADQIIQGDMLMIRNKDADITSIKLTNDEDDSDGVALPILVILGGI